MHGTQKSMLFLDFDMSYWVMVKDEESASGKYFVFCST